MTTLLPIAPILRIGVGSLLALLLTTSCMEHDASSTDPSQEHHSTDAGYDESVHEPDAIVEEAPPEMAPMPAPVEADATPAPVTGGGRDPASVEGGEEYKVVLGAEEQLQLPGLPGELRVWIGPIDRDPTLPNHFVADETRVPAEGKSAEVEPFAPGFEVSPAATQCIKLHPSGSEVRFQLRPKSAGDFKVGADIRLYDSVDCSGSPVPKTAATLTVTVEVSAPDWLMAKGNELWQIFWDQFIEFWAAFLGLFFALLLFLFKKSLKRRFGFGEGDDNGGPPA